MFRNPYRNKFVKILRVKSAFKYSWKTAKEIAKAQECLLSKTAPDNIGKNFQRAVQDWRRGSVHAYL